MSLRVYNDLVQGTERDRARLLRLASVGGPNDCWEWQSTFNPSGYGKFWLNGRTDLAHRASYTLHRGPIPKGLVVRHACDNKRCVNPAHLLIGTLKDNAHDAVERGLYPRGSRNGRAKLTERQVAEIRQRRRLGETQISLARCFGVSRSAIQWILNGRNWS